ncbi:MAG: hypothetical protein C4523_11655, partial [Myxococcales bacterium]
ELHGLWLGPQAAPQSIPGFPAQSIRVVRAVVRSGPPELAQWGLGGPAELGPIHNYMLEEREAAEAPTSAGGDPDAPAQWVEQYAGKFAVPDPKQPGRYFLPAPAKVSIRRGDAVELTLEIVEPKGDPTLAGWSPADVGLILPDRAKAIRTVAELKPTPKPDGPACWESPSKQFVCLYASTVAEFYVVAPFSEASFYGWWWRENKFTYIKPAPDKRAFHIDMSGPTLKSDFGEYGADWKPAVGPDRRLDPFDDLARIAGGEQPIASDSLKEVWFTQIAPGGENEAVVLLAQGEVVVIGRAGRFSPLKVLHRLPAPASRVRVVWDPVLSRAHIAIKGENDAAWNTWVYLQEEESWVKSVRERVPW